MTEPDSIFKKPPVIGEKCPSCKVKFINHLGLIGTCKELQDANEAIERLQKWLVVSQRNETKLKAKLKAAKCKK